MRHSLPVLACLAWAFTAQSFGCTSAPPEANPQSPAPRVSKPGTPVLAERALTLSIITRLAVRDVDEAAKRIRSEVSRTGGYLADLTLAPEREARLDARIPAGRLRDFREALVPLGKIESEMEKAEDVTDQRIDLGARLRNAALQEKRLLQLLDVRTGTLADVVAIEKELAAVREIIERSDAQRQSLEERVGLAEVSITLTRSLGPAWQTPIASLAEAGRGGLEACAGLLFGLAMAVVASAPTLVAFAALALLVWRMATLIAGWRGRRGAAGAR
ncbi:MAG: DUF4349 domain-containing protein [Deltaproteobacteria bacterium]|nr:DUF4349 domain-containing protein [Deltaproteobacteria bacterium]